MDYPYQQLYVGLENPTKEIVILTKYIMNVYAPAYFLIKLNSSVSDGARNYQNITISRKKI